MFGVEAASVHGLGALRALSKIEFVATPAVFSPVEISGQLGEIEFERFDGFSRESRINSALRQFGDDSARPIAPIRALSSEGFGEPPVRLQPGLGKGRDDLIDVRFRPALADELGFQFDRRVFATGKQPKRGLARLGCRCSRL